MSVLAKFVVDSTTQNRFGNYALVRLVAQWDDGIAENLGFAQATPFGSIELWIDNPDAANFFTLGKQVYVSFTEADPSQTGGGDDIGSVTQGPSGAGSSVSTSSGDSSTGSSSSSSTSTNSTPSSGSASAPSTPDSSAAAAPDPASASS